MSAITQQQEILEDIRTAKFITSTLRDISALKIQKIREEFQRNNAFYNEIRELYGTVKAYSLRAQEAEARRRLEEGETISKKQKRGNEKLVLAITSNKRFYGALNTDVMKAALDYLWKQHELDCLIVGQTGEQYLKQGVFSTRSCEMHFFADDDPTPEEVVALMEQLRGYRQIFVFYPKFMNVFRQDVAMVDITHTPEPAKIEKIDVEYIFEPELSEMLLFFETQVRHLLFNRVMLEAELARTAARLIKMQHAEQRADEVMEERQHMLRKELASLSSMRLLETFAGFKQWQK